MRVLNEALGVRDAVGEDVGGAEEIVFGGAPGEGEVAGDVEGDEAEGLLDVVDDEGLLHDVDGAEGDEVLEVVGEGLAAEVDAPDGVVEGEVVEDGGGVGEGEAGVQDEAAVGAGGGAARGLVEVDEGGGVGHVEGPEVEVLEDELVKGALDGGESEEGLRQEEGRLGGGYAEDGGEQVGPDFALQLWVYQVPAVHGPTGRCRSQVRLSPRVQVDPLLRGGRPVQAVRQDGRRVPLPAQARFYQAAAVVHNHYVRRRRHFAQWSTISLLSLYTILSPIEF